MSSSYVTSLPISLTAKLVLFIFRNEKPARISSHSLFVHAKKRPVLHNEVTQVPFNVLCIIILYHKAVS